MFSGSNKYAAQGRYITWCCTLKKEKIKSEKKSLLFAQIINQLAQSHNQTQTHRVYNIHMCFLSFTCLLQFIFGSFSLNLHILHIRSVFRSCISHSLDFPAQISSSFSLSNLFRLCCHLPVLFLSLSLCRKRTHIHAHTLTQTYNIFLALYFRC